MTGDPTTRRRESFIERRDNEVIVPRPGTKPSELRVLYIASLVATAACGLLVGRLPPVAGAMIVVCLGIAPMLLGAMVGAERAYGGRLLRVVRELKLVEGSAGSGYRDVADDTVFVDGQALPRRSVRRVVRGHTVNRTQHGETHAWPVYLVTTEHVIELASFGDESASLKFRREIADLFDVPMSERETWPFGAHDARGCATGVVTVALQTGLVTATSFAFLSEPSVWMALTPLMLALAIAITHWAASRFGAARARSIVDREVEAAFELASPKVRVEPIGRTFRDVADELRTERRREEE